MSQKKNPFKVKYWDDNTDRVVVTGFSNLSDAVLRKIQLEHRTPNPVWIEVLGKRV